MSTEKKELPPLSLTRESLRISAATLVSMIGTVFVLSYFMDSHWVTHKEYDVLKADQMKFAYYLRMATLKDMIHHLKAKKTVTPEIFTKVDQMTLEELEDEYARINDMYKTDQLKPK